MKSAQSKKKMKKLIWILLILILIPKYKKCGQFFVGRRRKYKLKSKNKKHKLHNKYFQNSFSFKANFEKEGKLAYGKDKESGQDRLTVESENGIDTSINSYLEGQGFSIENHSDLKDRIESQMGSMRSESLKKINSLRSVRIPELMYTSEFFMKKKQNLKKHAHFLKEQTKKRNNRENHRLRNINKHFDSTQNLNRYNDLLVDKRKNSNVKSYSLHSNKFNVNRKNKKNIQNKYGIFRKKSKELHFFDKSKENRKSGSILFNIHSSEDDNSKHLRQNKDSRFYGSERLVRNSNNSRSSGIQFDPENYYFRKKDRQYSGYQ